MRAKILIVEDHADFRRVLQIRLLAMGYGVTEAGTAEEGLERALAEIPDIIIMDIRLPGMDGIEATIKLKENPRTARIPVVAYTAWPADYQEKARRAGVAELMAKPASSDTFKKVLERVLEPGHRRPWHSRPSS